MISYKTIDDYLTTMNFPEETVEILQKMRKIINSIVPEAEEGIGYGIPTFRINGKYLIYFAGYKNHVSLYPIPRGDAAYEKEIAPYIAGRGTLKFQLNKPIPYDLIEKVVKQAKRKAGE